MTPASPARRNGKGGGIRLTAYQPPFIYFGGKSTVADVIWEALGDVENYVEPFAGSAAVLLLRPGGAGHVETINDSDGFVSNVWRAIKCDPEGVAEHADWIVDEASLHARHLWLIGQREALTDRLCGDPDFYDVKAAGYWLWGINCWIGSGWCSGNGPWVNENGEMVLGKSNGVWKQWPHLSNAGRGVNRKRPRLSGDSMGQGVNRDLPKDARLGNGECSDRAAWLRSYLQGFADRLRNVRICCGDWSRVCGPSVTFQHGMTGVLLDPPYAGTAGRTDGLYAHDCEEVAHRVREWAIEQGRNPLMRIVLCGYEGEHEMPDDWRVHEWEAVGGYGLISDDEESTGRANKGRERLWFSPACNRPRQGGLFDEVEAPR